jgi:hypothetical protein
MLAYAFTYAQNGLSMSDFFGPDLRGSGGQFFSLTASEPVTVDGTTFSPSEQRRIFSEGTASFYIALTVAQFVHIWACKTRVSSLFVHGVSNRLTFYGVAIGVALVVFFSYVPGVQNFVGSAQVGWIPWVCGPLAGAVLLAYNETVKCYIRSQAEKVQGCLVTLLSW